MVRIVNGEKILRSPPRNIPSCFNGRLEARTPISTYPAGRTIPAGMANKWGQVCDDGWQNEATNNPGKDIYASGVACRDLGFKQPNIKGSYFKVYKISPSPICGDEWVLDDLYCDGEWYTSVF